VSRHFYLYRKKMEGTETKPPAEHSAEEDVRTLHKAHEVRRDGKRMKAVKMLVRNQVRAISSGNVGRKGINGPITSRIASGETGRNGIGHGLTKRIAAGKVNRRASKRAHYARGGR
jgi:hypothetical protein